MAEQYYIKLPGGAILHQSDGSTLYYKYGEEVDLSELAGYQAETIDNVADNTQRSIENANVELARDAAAAEPAKEAAIPSNYNQLDENEAVTLVLNSSTAVQAEVLKHELIQQNRNKVIDAASSEAQDIARGEVAKLTSAGAAAKPKKRAARKVQPEATPDPAES